MKGPFFVLSILLMVLAAALWWLAQVDTRKHGLVLHCAAGLQKPMAEIARRYEEEHGVKIHLQLGGSGTLESQLLVAGGDLFLPADKSYFAALQEKGRLESTFPVATLTAGIVVPKGNPKKLHQLDDLVRSGLKISLAEKSASIGKHTWSVLEEEGFLDQIQPNIVVTKPTVNNIVEDVATGAVDATLAWDAVAWNFPEVEWLAVPEFSKHPKTASIGVLSSDELAHHFAAYARDEGREVFREMGYQVPE